MKIWEKLGNTLWECWNPSLVEESMVSSRANQRGTQILFDIDSPKQFSQLPFTCKSDKTKCTQWMKGKKRLNTYQICNKITNTIRTFTIIGHSLYQVFPLSWLPKFKYYEWRSDKKKDSYRLLENKEKRQKRSKGKIQKLWIYSLETQTSLLI